LRGWSCDLADGTALPVQIKYGGVLIAGGIVWQTASLGIINIMAGRSSGIEWLEIPLFRRAHARGLCAVGLWASYCGLRKQTSAYISVWYLLGAFVWFPWVFATAHIEQCRRCRAWQNVIAAWASQSFFSV
jgi:cytochrome c oxidase cbb3-type subunit 1